MHMRNKKTYKNSHIIRNLIMTPFILFCGLGIILVITGTYNLPVSKKFEKNRQSTVAHIVDRQIDYYGKYQKIPSYSLIYEFTPRESANSYKGDIEVEYSDYLTVPNDTKVVVYYDSTNPRNNYDVGTEISVNGNYFAIKLGVTLLILSVLALLALARDIKS